MEVNDARDPQDSALCSFPLHSLVQLSHGLASPHWIVYPSHLLACCESAAYILQHGVPTKDEVSAFHRFLTDVLPEATQRIISCSNLPAWSPELRRDSLLSFMAAGDIVVALGRRRAQLSELEAEWLTCTLRVVATALAPLTEFHAHHASQPCPPEATFGDSWATSERTSDGSQFAWLVGLLNRYGASGTIETCAHIVAERGAPFAVVEAAAQALHTMLHDLGTLLTARSHKIAVDAFQAAIAGVRRAATSGDIEALSQCGDDRNLSGLSTFLTRCTSALCAGVGVDAAIPLAVRTRMPLVEALLARRGFSPSLCGARELSAVLQLLSRGRGVLSDDTPGGLGQEAREWLGRLTVSRRLLQSHLHQAQYMREVRKVFLELAELDMLPREALEDLWRIVQRPDTFPAVRESLLELLADLAPALPGDSQADLLGRVRAMLTTGAEGARQAGAVLIRAAEGDGSRQAAMARGLLDALWHMRVSESTRQEWSQVEAATACVLEAYGKASKPAPAEEFVRRLFGLLCEGEAKEWRAAAAMLAAVLQRLRYLEEGHGDGEPIRLSGSVPAGAREQLLSLIASCAEEDRGTALDARSSVACLLTVLTHHHRITKTSIGTEDLDRIWAAMGAARVAASGPRERAAALDCFADYFLQAVDDFSNDVLLRLLEQHLRALDVDDITNAALALVFQGIRAYQARLGAPGDAAHLPGFETIWACALRATSPELSHTAIKVAINLHQGDVAGDMRQKNSRALTARCAQELALCAAALDAGGAAAAEADARAARCCRVLHLVVAGARDALRGVPTLRPHSAAFKASLGVRDCRVHYPSTTMQRLSVRFDPNTTVADLRAQILGGNDETRLRLTYAGTHARCIGLDRETMASIRMADGTELRLLEGTGAGAEGGANSAEDEAAAAWVATHPWVHRCLLFCAGSAAAGRDTHVAAQQCLDDLWTWKATVDGVEAALGAASDDGSNREGLRGLLEASLRGEAADGAHADNGGSRDAMSAPPTSLPSLPGPNPTVLLYALEALRGQLDPVTGPTAFSLRRVEQLTDSGELPLVLDAVLGALSSETPPCRYDTGRRLVAAALAIARTCGSPVADAHAAKDDGGRRLRGFVNFAARAVVWLLSSPAAKASPELELHTDEVVCALRLLGNGVHASPHGVRELIECPVSADLVVTALVSAAPQAIASACRRMLLNSAMAHDSSDDASVPDAVTWIFQRLSDAYDATCGQGDAATPNPAQQVQLFLIVQAAASRAANDSSAPPHVVDARRSFARKWLARLTQAVPRSARDDIAPPHQEWLRQLLTATEALVRFVGAPSSSTPAEEPLVERCLAMLFPEAIAQPGLATLVGAAPAELPRLARANGMSRPESVPVVACHSPAARSAAMAVLVAIARASLRDNARICDKLYELHLERLQARSVNLQPSLLPPQPSGYVGLKNAAATCYMNSVVQQLFMQPSIRANVLGTPAPGVDFDLTQNGGPGAPSASAGEESMHEQLRDIFAHLAMSRQEYFIPQAFWRAYKDYDGNPIDVHEHQDAYEFVTRLADMVDQPLLDVRLRPALQSVLGGTFVHKVASRDPDGCNCRSESTEGFINVSVDVAGHSGLIEALRAYVRTELLEGDNRYHCEPCGRKVDASRRTLFRGLPHTLLVHLKRFDFDHDTFQRLKISDRFAFPRDLDMTEFTEAGEAELSAHGSVDTAAGCQYELRGVVVHSGSAFAGHYYSYIQERVPGEGGVPTGGQWLRFDDTLVTQWDIEALEEDCYGGTATVGGATMLRPNSAYMLVYERVGDPEPCTSPEAAAAAASAATASTMRAAAPEAATSPGSEVEKKLALKDVEFGGWPARVPGRIHSRIVLERLLALQEHHTLCRDYCTLVMRLTQIGCNALHSSPPPRPTAELASPHKRPRTDPTQTADWNHLAAALSCVVAGFLFGIFLRVPDSVHPSTATNPSSEDSDDQDEELPGGVELAPAVCSCSPECAAMFLRAAAALRSPEGRARHGFGEDEFMPPAVTLSDLCVHGGGAAPTAAGDALAVATTNASDLMTSPGSETGVAAVEALEEIVAATLEHFAMIVPSSTNTTRRAKLAFTLSLNLQELLVRLLQIPVGAEVVLRVCVEDHASPDSKGLGVALMRMCQELACALSNSAVQSVQRRSDAERCGLAALIEIAKRIDCRGDPAVGQAHPHKVAWEARRGQARSVCWYHDAKFAFDVFNDTEVLWNVCDTALEPGNGNAADAMTYLDLVCHGRADLSRVVGYHLLASMQPVAALNDGQGGGSGRRASPRYAAVFDLEPAGDDREDYGPPTLFCMMQLVRYVCVRDTLQLTAYRLQYLLTCEPVGDDEAAQEGLIALMDCALEEGRLCAGVLRLIGMLANAVGVDNFARLLLAISTKYARQDAPTDPLSLLAAALCQTKSYGSKRDGWDESASKAVLPPRTRPPLAYQGQLRQWRTVVDTAVLPGAEAAAAVLDVEAVLRAVAAMPQCPRSYEEIMQAGQGIAIDVVTLVAEQDGPNVVGADQEGMALSDAGSGREGTGAEGDRNGGPSTPGQAQIGPQERPAGEGFDGDGLADSPQSSHGYQAAAQ
ncbi:unnamed protein product [Pedinophyceae sp. YPF-701]|nr:unnamed protein product [Pedinophyceae sp. YPF-701]